MTEGSSAIRGGQGAGPPPLRGSDPPPTLNPSGGSLLPFGAVLPGIAAPHPGAGHPLDHLPRPQSRRRSPVLPGERSEPSSRSGRPRPGGDPGTDGPTHAGPFPDSATKGGRPHPRPPSLTPGALPTGRRATRRGRLDICDTMATTDREGGGTSPRSAGTGGDQIEEEYSRTGSTRTTTRRERCQPTTAPAKGATITRSDIGIGADPS